MEQYKNPRSSTKFVVHHPEISGGLVDSLQESSKQDIVQFQRIYKFHHLPTVGRFNI